MAALPAQLARAALAVTAFACTPRLDESTIELRELGRSYTLVTRKDHDARRSSPVLVALHAYATDAAVLPSAFDLRSVAVAERDVILVVPRGTRDGKGAPFWNATRACCDAERRGPDDLGYLRAVLRDVRSRYAVDPSRVVAVGVSNGAFMAERWACTPGGDLDAIIAVSGAGPDAASDPPCAPSEPVSVLEIHGDADDVVRYAGGTMNGAPYPSAAASLEVWAARAGCDKARAVESSFGGAGLAVRSARRDCGAAHLALWTVPGGGHRLLVGSRLFARALDFVENGSSPQ